MIMGRPIVSSRNRRKLDGIRHGMSPSWPMTPFLAVATTRVIDTASDLWFPIPSTRFHLLLTELEITTVLDRRLLDRLELTLQTPQLGRSLIVPADQKRGRPEHDDRYSRCDCIVRRLLVLRP
jgi:hypothetical protein